MEAVDKKRGDPHKLKAYILTAAQKQKRIEVNNNFYMKR